MDELTALRRRLHQHPELSDDETRTAARIAATLRELEPDALWRDLGGHGVAAAFHGAANGPTVLFRCELDALPITETGDRPHRSRHAGVAHCCGHDGHMAILIGLARHLAERRPDRGRVVLLFQPAEETGAGARRVAADRRFADLAADHAFALHNLPGYPEGAVVLREGTFSCASRGLVASLHGRTAHAAHPEDGTSPGPALAELLTTLPELPRDPSLRDGGFTLVTVVHARLGEVAFGTSPADGVVMATLRAEHDSAMQRLADLATAHVERVAATHHLRCRIDWQDVFDATVNDAQATALIREAARATGAPVIELDHPFRWSEDFGALARHCEHAAMFGFGAGEDHARLHASDYDFPDSLLGPAISLLAELTRSCRG